MKPAEISFVIDPHRRLVRVTAVGEAQWPEWTDLFDRVFATTGHEPGMDFLIDRRRITSIPTRETVDRIVRYYASHGEQFGRCRVASVTSSDAVYGMNRMAAVLAEETTVSVQVFRDIESALAWLRPD